MRWKCPNPDCPPTDNRPEDVTSFGDQVPMAVCGGKCGQEYPKAQFKLLR